MLTLPVKNLNSLPMSTSLSSLSAKQLRRAAALKEKIQSLENKLLQMLGSSTNTVASAVPRRKWKMSAAGRAKIAAAAKARWAKVKAGKSSAKPKAKRKMSAAGRARIRAAVKARWARVKAAKKK
jgi:hypothetical protein